MAEQKRINKQTTESKQEVDNTQPKAAENVEEVKSDIDDLLDEIDSVLEENAEEFVKAYVQKGGE